MAVMVAERPTAESRVKAALWFAEQGFGIFTVWSTTAGGRCRCPAGANCTSPGKHPITPNGFKDATTDPARIRTMLAAGSDPNYGMVCPEGVFALDVDGEDLARFAALEQRLGALPPTLRTLTANGQHVFLRWPEGLPRPLKQMFGMVTRWGSGKDAGYVIGPRSIHPSGFAYAPEGPLSIAEMPAGWAEEAITYERPRHDDSGIRGPEALPTAGHRHEWLRNRARFYWGMTGDKAVTRAAVWAENLKLDEPKSEEEVDRAIGEVEQFSPDPPEQTEERVAKKLGDDIEIGLLDLPSTGQFPDAPSELAFEGTIGDLVADLETGTDASRIGLLGSLYAFCGALFPSHAYFHRTHTSSPYVALVGESSIGRKGTAMNRAADAMSDALDIATVNRSVLDGVNSGEGLVSALYYKHENFKHEPTVGLLYEEELAGMLASSGRDGSTLDSKLRQAFDGGSLSNRRSSETKTVPAPYWLPALMGITPVELRSKIKQEAVQSGSTNRWIHLPVVKRSGAYMNLPPRFSPDRKMMLSDLHRQLQKTVHQPSVDADVTTLLGDYSEFLMTAGRGLSSDLTRRFNVIAFRLALIQATMDRSSAVTLEHTRRALEMTEYARRGISWIFGETIGNPEANLIYRYLVELGHLRINSITQHIIRDPARRTAAIDELLRLKLARRVGVVTHGRTRHELVLGDESMAFVRFVHYLLLRQRDQDEKPAQNAQKSVEPRTEGAQKLHESSTEGAQNLADWCLFYREHQSRHRDVNSDPWCEICSPRVEST